MILTVNEMEVDVRAGTVEDVPLLLAFIRAMAKFEKLEATATEHSLRTALFGEEPAARTLLAFVDGRPAGYAIYFFSFTSMMGRRALWIDDLFVDAAFRGRGVGKALMACLARIAVQHECARLEWIVLDWNKSAIGFYDRLGAEILTEWRICRVGETGLARMADVIGN